MLSKIGKGMGHCPRSTTVSMIISRHGKHRKFASPGIKMLDRSSLISRPCILVIRDWFLIMVSVWGGGGLQNGKIAGPKPFAPPPSRQCKTFRAPLLKSGNFFARPLLVVVKLHMPPPPSRFVDSPPPLPVISDRSLTCCM